jgi:hypothetical protein
MLNFSKEYFKHIINFNSGNIQTEILLNEFQNFLKENKIEIDLIEKDYKNKNSLRGGFNKGRLIEYILIPNNNKKATEYYFFGNNKIYAGALNLYNNIYYKFYSLKLIRDEDFDKDFIIVYEDINENNYKEHIKEEHINNNCRIGKINILNEENKIKYLKIKLVEEWLEVLKATDEKNLIEELGDYYCVLITLLNTI